jgi:5-methylcytosine-specific restriction protein A
MPYAPKKPCSQPGCPALTNGGGCEKQTRPMYSKPRPNAAQRGYNWQWQEARAGFL